MTRSLRGRMMLFGLTCFVAGAVAFRTMGEFLFEWEGAMLGFLPCEWYPASEWASFVNCEPDWPVDERVTATTGVLLGVVALVLLVRAAAARMVRPLTDITQAMGELGPQNMGQRVRYRGRYGEVRTLADALDAMLDRMATGYEGQRSFASNASHELRTPLAVQRTLVEVALVTGEQDLSRLAAQLLAVNERNEQLIEGLLVLAESDRGLPGTEPVRLDILVREVLDRYESLAVEHQVTLVRDLAEHTVAGDPVLLDRLVGNLIHNAIKYNRPQGTVEVVVADKPALSVHNTGQQVPAETVPALFEPFRRLTAERTHQRDGAGLGLSIVRSIVSAHSGTVSASPGKEGGLEITVSLPASGPRRTHRTRRIQRT